MKFSLDQAGGFAIRSYSADTIIVTRRHAEGDDTAPVTNERILSQSLILTADTIVEDWPIRRVEHLKSEHVTPILELEPELVILGVGPRLRYPDQNVVARFATAQVGVEIMDTGAACRTYNVLMTEGRHVVAALILE